jgi:hypothetical protein
MRSFRRARSLTLVIGDARVARRFLAGESDNPLSRDGAGCGEVEAVLRGPDPIRDSTNRDGAVLNCTDRGWQRFVSAIRRGELGLQSRAGQLRIAIVSVSVCHWHLLWRRNSAQGRWRVFRLQAGEA